MGYDPSEPRDDLGRWTTTEEHDILRRAGVRLSIQKSAQAAIRGGGAYNPFLRTVILDKPNVPIVAHEIGHALDHALAQPKGKPAIGSVKYWSDKGLQKAIHEDVKAIRSRVPTFLRKSGFNPENAFAYQISKPTEAFAHVYATLRQPPSHEIQINDFKFTKEFPRVTKLVERKMRMKLGR